MGQSPNIVLTTQFTVNQPFGSFLKYMDREEAKQSKELELSESQKGIEEVTPEEMKIYLHYMNREKALIDKKKMSPADFKELELISQHNDAFRKKLEMMKNESYQSEKLETGLFDLKNNDLSKKEMKQYEEKFDQAQQRGNVLFQDVVSFDTQGLIKAGIYNPYNNHLKRQPLIDATRKMMQTCFREEKMNADTISIGAIHYNTEHFHIHVATIEPTVSTRGQTKEGTQRGKRKKETINAMKQTFANEIFDRDQQLKQLSELRNSLRQEIKPTLSNPVPAELKRLRKTLPDDYSKWNAKSLSPESQRIMYQLIDRVMEKNENFKAYKQLAKEEDRFKKETYGVLPKGQRSFYEGRMYGADGVYYRLSNSVLEEMKKMEKEKQNNKQVKSISVGVQIRRCHSSMDYELRKMNRHLKKSISKEKQKAQREFEQDQRQYADLDL